MLHWIEITSDGQKYMIDHSKVSLVTDIRHHQVTPSWIDRIFGFKYKDDYYSFSFKLDGTRETVVSDTYEEAKEQQLLLLGVRNGTSNS